MSVIQSLSKRSVGFAGAPMLAPVSVVLVDLEEAGVADTPQVGNRSSRFS